VGKGFLIDSNSIIDFFNNSLPKKGIDLLLSLQPQISIIIQKNCRDAIIAATALHHNLILITRNISDFEKINGLEVINSHAV
jgi:hypothetical protein